MHLIDLALPPSGSAMRRLARWPLCVNRRLKARRRQSPAIAELHALARQVRTERPQSPLLCISLVEHMGDVVAAEPIGRTLRDQYPNAWIAWCVHRAFRS